MVNVNEEVKKIILEKCKGKSVELTNETTFNDLNFDSLDTVDLMMGIEDKLNITFEDDMQTDNLNLGELVLKIESLMNARK